jgi:hypothetical protein
LLRQILNLLAPLNLNLTHVHFPFHHHQSFLTLIYLVIAVKRQPSIARRNLPAPHLKAASRVPLSRTTFSTLHFRFCDISVCDNKIILANIPAEIF